MASPDIFMAQATANKEVPIIVFQMAALQKKLLWIINDQIRLDQLRLD